MHEVEGVGWRVSWVEGVWGEGRVGCRMCVKSVQVEGTCV